MDLGAAIFGRPLVQRRAQLEALLRRTGCGVIRFSESFPDTYASLAECARCGLEGVVSKPKDSVYQLRTRSGWIKVKTDAWKAACPARAPVLMQPHPEAVELHFVQPRLAGRLGDVY